MLFVTPFLLEDSERKCFMKNLIKAVKSATRIASFINETHDVEELFFNEEFKQEIKTAEQAAVDSALAFIGKTPKNNISRVAEFLDTPVGQELIGLGHYCLNRLLSWEPKYEVVDGNLKMVPNFRKDAE